jgi:YD repeat-containing protein
MSQAVENPIAMPGSRHEGVITAITRVGVSLDCGALGKVLVHASTFSSDTTHVIGQILPVFVSKCRADGKIDALFSPPTAGDLKKGKGHSSASSLVSYAKSQNYVPIKADDSMSFSDTQQTLIEFRDASGFEHWYDYAKYGWDKLGSFSNIEELSELCEGVEAKEGKLHRIDLDGCNLQGNIQLCARF